MFARLLVGSRGESLINFSTHCVIMTQRTLLPPPPPCYLCNFQIFDEIDSLPKNFFECLQNKKKANWNFGELKLEIEIAAKKLFNPESTQSLSEESLKGKKRNVYWYVLCSLSTWPSIQILNFAKLLNIFAKCSVLDICSE